MLNRPAAATGYASAFAAILIMATASLLWAESAASPAVPPVDPAASSSGGGAAGPGADAGLAVGGQAVGGRAVGGQAVGGQAESGQGESGQAGGAVTAEEIRHLAEVLMVDATVEMMRDEGIEFGTELADPQRSGSSPEHWRERLGQIYALPLMRQLFVDTLQQQLAQDRDTLRDGLAFFGSELGQRILTLEVEARRTLTDEVAEEAAKLSFAEMQAASDPRVEMIYRLAELNDLVEANVVMTLNANLAFLKAAGQGGAAGEGMDEEQMLSMIWVREEAVRADAEAWIYPYLTFSYASLRDEELEKYMAFSETRAAKRLNVAIAAAIERLFTQTSQELGALLGAQIRGDDI